MKSVEKHKDFRLRLQHELIRRCEKNPHYSLRSFAKQLGIYHATLSALIAGKRSVTSATIKKLGTSLGLTPNELADYMTTTSASAQSKSPTAYFELTQDSFNAISEWYYDAILELILVKDFKADARWIAQVLSITASQAKIALETLQRLELVAVNSYGDLELTQRNSTNILDPNFTNAAMKKHQKQILEKSVSAIDDVEKTLRDHTSTAVAIDPKDLPQIKEIIKKFRYELASFVQRKGINAKDVFQLQVSFFPLTKINKKRGNT